MSCDGDVGGYSVLWIKESFVRYSTPDVSIGGSSW